jgi:hypothetical protein
MGIITEAVQENGIRTRQNCAEKNSNMVKKLPSPRNPFSDFGEQWPIVCEKHV